MLQLSDMKSEVERKMNNMYNDKDISDETKEQVLGMLYSIVNNIDLLSVAPRNSYNNKDIM